MQFSRSRWLVADHPALLPQCDSSYVRPPITDRTFVPEIY